MGNLYVGFLGYKSFKSLYCYMCGYLYTQFILTKYKYMLLKKKQVSTFYKFKKKNFKWCEKFYIIGGYNCEPL